MAFSDKYIKRDKGNNPIPQFFDISLNDFSPLLGSGGATRHILYDVNGNPLSVVSNKLAVRAAEIEALLSTISGKDFATQTTLAAILAKLIAAPATEAKQDSIIGYIDGIESALTTLNAKDFATQTTLAAILTQLNMTGLKKIIDALPAGTNLLGKVGIDQTTPGTTNKVIAGIESDYPAGAVPWAVTEDSSANTAKTLTKAAGGAGKYHYITALEIVISGAAAGADIICVLKDDNAGAPTSYWKSVIGNAAPRGARTGIAFTKPIKLGANKTADLVVSAGGASVVTSLSMAGYAL